MNWLKSLALTALLLAASCGGPDDSKVLGEWKGEFLSPDGKSTPGANLSFDNDHHFRELYKNFEVKGTWSFSDKTVTLKIETFSGMPVAEAQKRMLAGASRSKNPAAAKKMAENLPKPIEITLSKDGKELTTHHDDLAGGYTVYKKE